MIPKWLITEIEKEREQLKAELKTAGQLPSSCPQAKPSANILRWRLCLQRSAPPMAGKSWSLADDPSSKVVLRAFGVVVGHSPSTILSLPAFVSRSPPDNSCMYPSWISRSLCSTGIARCVKPLAQSRNETNSSWVNGGGAGAIPRICANSSSGRLISSNVATWVLSNQDSNVAPQTSQDARPVCGIKNFASVRSYSAPQLHLTIVAILGICARNRPFSSA